ncbi:MAG: hypothetical protein MK212_22275, partial [Saprospiraceae bacterium]|nr:hypothetical protein [Saprospiraceae bacterium]
IAATYNQVQSPHGQALQTNNLFNVPSAHKYGYDQNLVVLSANNAEFDAINFESFEYEEGATLESGVTAEQPNSWSLQGVAAHTGAQGYRSILVNNTGNSGKLVIATDIRVTDKLTEGGETIKLWISNRDIDGNTLNLLPNSVKLTASNGNQDIAIVSMQAVARVGKWFLVEGHFTKNMLQAWSNNGVEKFTIKLWTENIGQDPFFTYVDDIVVHPTESSVTARVYDPVTFRTIATFGDTHFAVLPQYDSEGKLVRQRVETEKGIKTVKEVYHHITPRP